MGNDTMLHSRLALVMTLLAGCAAPTAEPADTTSPDGKADGAESACIDETLVFSADDLPVVPAAGSRKVWGANATQGNHVTDPPFDEDFLRAADRASGRGLRVFAYLEGPCGDTGGVDDGERARCRALHADFNAQFAPATPDTALARWKPYTLAQLEQSGSFGIDYCEIDNLSNNVTIPLVPLLRELKQRHDDGLDHCQIVFKNLSVDDLAAIKEEVAPTLAEAAFVAPFHIYEAEDLSEKAALDAAMQNLKGPGAVTIMSLDTNHYGAAFTPDTFKSCGGGT